MMLRAAEALGFVALATGLHALVFIGTEGGQSRAPAPASDARPAFRSAPQMAALVDRWDTPPEVAAPPDQVPPAPADAESPAMPSAAESPPPTQPELARPSAPQTESPPAPPSQALRPPALAPTAPTLGAIPLPQTDSPTPAAPTRAAQPNRAPVSAIAAPQRAPEPPKLESRPPEPPEIAAPDRSLRPVPRPDRPTRAAPAPRKPAAETRSAPAAPAPRTAPKAAPKTAASTAKSTQSSQQSVAKKPKKSSAGLSGEAERQAIGQWGAQITARIHGRAAKPRGSRNGKVRLSLTVSRTGQLLSVSVARSSGDPKLDAAALHAARKARLPRAPKGLSKASYTFGYTLSFRS